MKFILFITLMFTCSCATIPPSDSWILQGPNGPIYVKIAPWAEKMISKYQAQDYISYGFKDPNVVEEWHTHGLTADNMREWGPTYDAKTVEEWVQMGFDKHESSGCINNGYPINRVKELIKSGFQDKNIKAICNTEETTRIEWETQKFTLKQLSQWSLGFDLEDAVKWRTAGFTYSEAENYKSFGFELQVALKIKRNCPGGIRPLNELFLTNPYNVAGRCYQFVGGTQQILSRSTALFNQSGQGFYIDFGKTSAPTISFRGVVKGVGVYEYTTTIGSVMKVPHLTSVYWSE